MMSPLQILVADLYALQGFPYCCRPQVTCWKIGDDKGLVAWVARSMVTSDKLPIIREKKIGDLPARNQVARALASKI